MSGPPSQGSDLQHAKGNTDCCSIADKDHKAATSDHITKHHQTEVQLHSQQCARLAQTTYDKMYWSVKH
jgi:hypothetical protein